MIIQEDLDNYEAYKVLSATVLAFVVKDIRAGKTLGKKAEMDVLSGRCDVFMETVGINLTREEFIERAKKGAKQNDKLRTN